jgi:hypothetical protein
MAYIMLDTKEIISQEEIIKRNPNTSFPLIWDNTLCEFLNIAVVFSAPQPSFDSITQSVREIEPVLTDKGHWEQQWEIIELDEDLVKSNMASRLAQVKQSIVNSVQIRLDEFAKTRNYDSILSACTYATSSIPQFQSEGQLCVELRDNTWSTLYSILTEVEAGIRPLPNSYNDVEADLPVLEWA